MNHLTIPQSPEEQHRRSIQLYRLMAKQAESYHRHRHMGTNSSISMELAQELMESIDYTLSQIGGIYAAESVEHALTLGQQILEEKHSQALQLLSLVEATAPAWQTDCRWEALHCLRQYLSAYDHLHLAHRSPDDLFYPVLISPPEGAQGIDRCRFYLQILWIENQIMAAFPEESLNPLWDQLPTGALNPCEQLLVNAMGKILIGADLTPLTFEPKDHMRLIPILLRATEHTLKTAANNLCGKLNLPGDEAVQYIHAIIPQIKLWTGEQALSCNLENVFL